MNSDNYQTLLDKVRRQRISIRRRDELSQKLLLENLEKKQLSFESKRVQQKTLIEKYRKMLSWTSISPIRKKVLPKFKVKKVLEAVNEAESPEKATDQIFGLTEVISKPATKKVPIEGGSPKILVKSSSKTDFINLSPRYIIEKITEAQRKHEKVRFKGIGLEATTYYRRYMMTSPREVKYASKKSGLEEKYLKSMKVQKKPNEHIQSINRIKKQMKRISEKRNASFTVVLESNLDNAFRRMDQDLNRVAAYAKYSLDFP